MDSDLGHVLCMWVCVNVSSCIRNIMCGSSSRENRVTISGIAVLGTIFAMDTMGLIAICMVMLDDVFTSYPHKGGASTNTGHNVNFNGFVY